MTSPASQNHPQVQLPPPIPHQKWSFSSVLMVVLWPSFLMACVASGIFFSLIDPMELIVLDERVQVHMLGSYTIGFLIFWALGSLSSYLTALLLKTPLPK